MNSINIIGRLCADPELRRTNDGTPVCSYSLAVKRPMVKDTTDFIECVTWRQGAEYLAQYGHKGDIVAVSGSLQVREWTDKEGKKRKAYEVVTTSVELLSSKRNSEAGGNTTQNQNGFQGQARQPQQNYQQPQYNQQGFGGYIDDDPKLPF
jgi:single-strand DNA-binding protein